MFKNYQFDRYFNSIFLKLIARIKYIFEKHIYIYIEIKFKLHDQNIIMCKLTITFKKNRSISLSKKNSIEVIQLNQKL